MACTSTARTGWTATTVAFSSHSELTRNVVSLSSVIYRCSSTRFVIAVPVGSRSGGERGVWLCATCWPAWVKWAATSGLSIDPDLCELGPEGRRLPCCWSTVPAPSVSRQDDRVEDGRRRAWQHRRDRGSRRFHARPNEQALAVRDDDDGARLPGRDRDGAGLRCTTLSGYVSPGGGAACRYHRWQLVLVHRVAVLQRSCQGCGRAFSEATGGGAGGGGPHLGAGAPGGSGREGCRTRW